MTYGYIGHTSDRIIWSGIWGQQKNNTLRRSFPMGFTNTHVQHPKITSKSGYAGHCGCGRTRAIYIYIYTVLVSLVLFHRKLLNYWKVLSHQRRLARLVSDVTVGPPSSLTTSCNNLSLPSSVSHQKHSTKREAKNKYNSLRLFPIAQGALLHKGVPCCF